MDFFDRVKELAKQKGTTIESMLQSAGNISLNTYNGWKKRDITPRADICCLIAKYLGVTTEYLVLGVDENHSLYPHSVEEIADACMFATHEQLIAVRLILHINGHNGNSLVKSS